jgi:hypothetical protein
MGDTQNTQILSQLDISSEMPVSPRGDDGVWGRLYPIGSGFQKFGKYALFEWTLHE